MGKKKYKRGNKRKAKSRPIKSHRRLIWRWGFLALLGLAFIWWVIAARGEETVPVYTYQVVRKLPHDAEAYTQGLIYRNGYFYESTGGYGTSSIRRVDPHSGQVLDQKALDPRYFAEGLTFFKGVLMQLTWKEGMALVYNSDNFELLRVFNYDTQGWGLTGDGHRLIMSDGSERLYFRDPTSFEVTRTLAVTDRDGPVRGLNELEFIQGEIWANVYQSFEIVRISPKTGKVLGRVNLRGILSAGDRNGREDVLNGIAYDPEGNRVFVTGKRYSHIYEIKIVKKKKHA